MLTSADKLKCKTTDSDDFVDPSVKQGIFNFNFKELFESNRPSDYLVSFYHNYSLKEEKQKKKCEKSNDNKYFVSMRMYYLFKLFLHFISKLNKLLYYRYLKCYIILENFLTILTITYINITKY